MSSQDLDETSSPIPSRSSSSHSLSDMAVTESIKTRSITARTSPSRYAPTFRKAATVFLPLLSCTAFYCIWYQSFQNGLFKQMGDIRNQTEPKVAGTDEPLLSVYTGIRAIDSQLSILVDFFLPVLDGSSNDMTLYVIDMFGQFGAGWTLLMMESLRKGNQGRIPNFIGTYGVLVQNLTFAFTTPLFLFVHLLSSPIAKPFPSTHASSVLLVTPYDLSLLPFSVILGYIVPALLMALPAPDIVSYANHQKLIAFWQPFPVWTVIIHTILRQTCRTLFEKRNISATTPQPKIAPSITYLKSAGRVYTFALMFCMVTHLPIIFIALTPEWLFSSSWPLLQSLSTSTFASIYLPPLPFPIAPVANLATGCLNFLQWDVYIAGTASLIWGVILYRNAYTEREIVDPTTSLPIYRELLSGERYPDRNVGLKLTFKLLFWTLLSGPFGALTVLLWERDAIVKQKIKQGI